MNTHQLPGTWTALITPFNEDGTIDLASFDALVDRQLEAGITGVLINGTTGESPTLTDDEAKNLIQRAKARANGRCLIMAGTGTNNTQKSIEKTKRAAEAGADAILLVNPYYNKPTQQGLYLHFKAIAESTNLPVVLYNIKGRTGVNLETATLLRLARDAQNIVGVKEASGDVKQINEVCTQRPQDFVVLSGDDGITYEVMKNSGADGVISVASNIVPAQVINMVQSALQQNWDQAAKFNEQLQPLFKALFVETNPIPVKYAAYKLGWCQNVYRLPMCPISEAGAKIVDEAIKGLSL